MYLRQTRLSGPRSDYCAAGRRPQSAPVKKTVPRLVTTNQECFVRPPHGECLEATRQAAELRRRLMDKMSGADVFFTAENAARNVRLRRPPERQIQQMAGKITYTGESRYLD